MKLALHRSTLQALKRNNRIDLTAIKDYHLVDTDSVKKKYKGNSSEWL
jgi:hypothetical protein